MANFIELFKKLRKKQQINRAYQHQYAFVGIGNHSLNNLYPILDYLNVPLKYIVTKNKDTATWVDANYAAVTGTNNFEQVLQDPTVKGIFICAQPNSHYQLVKQAFQHQKHVFVEKPPCFTLEELSDLVQLQQQSKTNCVVGLQKRYATGIQLLKQEIKSDTIISYHYHFVVGAYPEGDVLMDLFIHPLDLCVYLFGVPQNVSVIKTGKEGQITYLLQLQHAGCIGQIELSTQYNWTTASEHLSVNCQKAVYETTNHQNLIRRKKQVAIMGVPTEKLFAKHPQSEILFDSNSFMPTINNNQLHAQGYYAEIAQFIKLCEGHKTSNLSTLESVLPTFELINKIKKYHV